MLPILSLETSLVASGVAAAADFVMLRVLCPGAWRRRSVRRASLLVLLLVPLSHGAWALGASCPKGSSLGVTVSTVELIVLALVGASLPVALALRFASAFALARRPTHRSPSSAAASPIEASGGAPALSRRSFVQAVSLAPPALALGTSLDGFLTAASAPATPHILARFPHLPRPLQGFRILQLSDLHLGASKALPDLMAFLARFADREPRPDLVVFTGDVADDLGQLTDALNAAWDLRPRYGVFACLGNHEYLHDIRRSRPLYERSHVPLLVDEGVVIPVPGAPFWLAAVDDPIAIGGEIRGRLRASVDRALDRAPADGFRLLLSHRPEGFELAASRGVDLTLSGHTHGGQIGFNGKSAFEPLFEDGYLWGSYGRGGSRLYTTSGFGHWLPFRVGCPTEAPSIILTG